jgi:WD40 repeat protein
MYLSSHEYRVTSLVVTADGSLLASGARNGRIRLWRLPSGEPAAAMSRHPSGVACLAAGPDGNLLASGGPDGVRLWRLPSGEPAGVLCGAEHPVGFLMLNRDGQLLVSGGDDGQIRLWRLTRLTEVCRTAAPDLDPAEAERLVRASQARPGPERDWALMIAALVRRWHRYDIEVAAVEPGTGPGATDIDLGRDPTDPASR